jgi:pimeloyl-ACP methyl ester carboxylesterase
VHGAWHGPWCWDRVVPPLTERGVETISLDLPSMDVNAGYVTTRHDDAKALRAELDALVRPAVVVGHSYGGMVITEGAADHRMVKRLVYLAAFMPDAGESENGLLALAPSPGLFNALRVGDDRRLTLDPAVVGPLLYGDCDEATVAWAVAHLRSMLSEGADPITAPAWRGISSTYVVCAQDNAILPELQRHMARNADEVLEWDTSHSPFASQPSLVADLLARLAAA